MFARTKLDLWVSVISFTEDVRGCTIREAAALADEGLWSNEHRMQSLLTLAVVSAALFCILSP